METDERGAVVKMQTRDRKLLTFSNGGSGCKGWRVHKQALKQGHLSLVVDWELLDGYSAMWMVPGPLRAW